MIRGANKLVEMNNKMDNKMEDKLKELINRECDKILGEIIRKDFDPRKPESSLLFKTEYCKGFREGYKRGAQLIVERLNKAFDL